MIKIPITISPHIVKEKPRGYYILAQRLFPAGAPILNKHQFLGFYSAKSCLIVTVEHNPKWDSLLKMAIYLSQLVDSAVSWLAPTPLYVMSMGFRTYIPGSILKPTSAGEKKTETFGLFCKEIVGSTVVFYLEIPRISANVLLGRENLICQ